MTNHWHDRSCLHTIMMLLVNVFHSQATTHWHVRQWNVALTIVKRQIINIRNKKISVERRIPGKVKAILTDLEDLEDSETGGLDYSSEVRNRISRDCS